MGTTCKKRDRCTYRSSIRCSMMTIIRFMISAFIFSRKQKKTIYICYTRDIEYIDFDNVSKTQTKLKMETIAVGRETCARMHHANLLHKSPLLACRILPRIVICCAEYNRAREISDSVRQQPSTAKLEIFLISSSQRVLRISSLRTRKQLVEICKRVFRYELFFFLLT